MAPPEPEIDAETAQEMILLRRHYGLSAEDIWGSPGRALPAWEVEWLAASLGGVEDGPPDGGSVTDADGLPDPFAASVPD